MSSNSSKGQEGLPFHNSYLFYKHSKNNSHNQDKFNIYLHPKNKNSVTNYLFKNTIVPNIKNTNWGFLIEAQISLLETSLTHDKNNQKF